MILVSIDLLLFTKASIHNIRKAASNSDTLDLWLVIKFTCRNTLFTCGNSDIFTVLVIVETFSKNRKCIIKIEEEIC